MFTLSEILNTVQLVSLIIITGGTLTIGALAAPTIFGNLCYEEAGAVMVELFRKFDRWIKFAAIALLGSKLIELVMVNRFKFVNEVIVGDTVSKSFNISLLISVFLVFAIAATSLHLAYKLSPQIVRSYEEDSPAFTSLHKQSEFLHKINFLLGLALLVSFAL